MRPYRCIYLGGGGASGALTVGDLARALQGFHDQMWTILDDKVDGYNIKSAFAGDGLGFTTQTQTGPKVLYVPALSSGTQAYIRKKAKAGTVVGKEPGLELVVDTSDATYGRVCIVDKVEGTKQLYSAVPDNPATVTNPGTRLVTPYGAHILDTGGAFDVIFRRNGVEQARLNGSVVLVAVPIAGSTSASGNLTLESTTHATKGKVLFGANAAYDESSGSIGLGTQSPLYGLHMLYTGAIPATAGYHIAVETRHNTTSPYLAFLRARAGNAAVSLNDILGAVDFQGEDGFGSGQHGGLIEVRVDGAVSHGSVPSRMLFYINNSEKMRLDSAGNLGVGATAAAGYRVDVSGKIRASTQIESSQATGTAPLVVASTTAVTNLNGDMVDGAHASTTPAAGVIPIGDGTGRLTAAQQASTTEYTTNKNAASGYAGIDAGSRIAKAQAPAATVYNDQGNTYSSGVSTTQDFSNVFATKVGAFSPKTTTKTASNGATFAMGSTGTTIATVFVDASGLSGAQNYTVQLPKAGDYPDRQITVAAVIAAASGSPTLTLSSLLGNVQGAATQVLDLTPPALPIKRLQSDGTDWWYV